MTDQLSFDDLRKYDANPPDSALPRNKGVATRYGYYIKSFKKKGSSLGQFILKNIFDNYENEQFIITVNEFPYNVDDDVVHLVVWQNPMLEANETDIRKFLAEKLSSENFVLYQNKVKHQSVSTVPHWQLFIKRENVNMLPIVEFKKLNNTT